MQGFNTMMVLMSRQMHMTGAMMRTMVNNVLLFLGHGCGRFFYTLMWLCGIGTRVPKGSTN